MTDTIERQEALKYCIDIIRVHLIAIATQGGRVKTPLIIENVDLFEPILKEKYAIVGKPLVIEKLIELFSASHGGSSSLSNDIGHEDWLDSDRKKDWAYWNRYSAFTGQKISPSGIEELDRSTDTILSQIEDPKRSGEWDRRGLVVGHVQSGKTSNYTGVICKAADAGYKIIIVLAGLHNNLRSQTQLRLDEGFLGYKSYSTDEQKICGVGLYDRRLSVIPNCGTNSHENGDFKAASVRMKFIPGDRPTLFVIKKNKSVLTHIISWLKNVAVEHDGDGRVTHLPLLVIDDECDQASVDTKEQVIDDNGNPDPDHDPTRINSLIRELLHLFTRKAYIGYTATPFANIFIHKSADTDKVGPDLFPSAFVHSLGTPENYVGPAKLFHEFRENGRNPMIRSLGDTDPECWLPAAHKNGDLPRYNGNEALPPSLEEAVRSFLYACAIRKLRGQGNNHSSMLIHVTRFTSIQEQVFIQVTAYVKDLSDRFSRNIELGEIENIMKSEYEGSFSPGMAEIFTSICSGNNDIETHDWESVREVLPSVLADIKTRQINGSAGDTLDYTAHEKKGLKVIAIGGDKLARGLTLEGLCTSYFARTTKMYDTLMQMGRWFGYRDGYVDVCRLYLSEELIEWYGHIADASQELREELDVMAERGGTPQDYGLRVKSHSCMAVTSLLKMHHTEGVRVSFSGDLVQTVVFSTQKHILDRNLKTVETLIEALGQGDSFEEPDEKSSRISSIGWQWRNAKAIDVTGFLDNYTTHKDSVRVNSVVLARFIDMMSRTNELQDWSVALLGPRASNEHSIRDICGHRINTVKRTQKGEQQEGKYSIGTLVSPNDEAMDLTRKQWDAALDLTRNSGDNANRNADEKKNIQRPTGKAIRDILGKGPEADRSRGRLLIYLLNPSESGHNSLEKQDKPVVGWAISFPGSSSGRAMNDDVFIANTVAWAEYNRR